MSSPRFARRPLSTALAVALAGGAPFILALSALGQNALNSQSLDRNLQSGSGGRNQPRAVENFASRNDIVTGNVAGGKQFRGNVGYTDPKAFRGVAGSDALFQFRANSALSSLPAVMGGVTADRYSLANSNVITFNRDTTPGPLPNVAPTFRRPPSLDARVLIDRASSAGTTTQYLSRVADGGVIGGVQDAQGKPFAVIGSPITGIRYEPMDRDGVRAVDVGLYDWRRLLDSGLDRGLLVPADPDAARTGAASEPNPLATPDKRVDERRRLGVGEASYESLVKALIERYATTPGTTVSVQGPELERALRAELEKLTEEMGERSPDFERIFPGVLPPSPLRRPAATPSGERTPDDATRPGEAPGAPLGPDGLPAGATPGATPGANSGATSGGESPDAAAPKRMTLEQLAALLRSSDTVTTLSPEQTSQADQLVARGEGQLRDGEFFFAEQSFDRALRIAPGHPMATAGLIHSQIGAGLYLSASVHLRRFFTAQPAMVGTRFAAGLLPPSGRLAQNAEAIRGLMAKDGPDRADYGLTLAYIGHQTGDATLMRLGLDAVQGDAGADALRRLLKQVWLNE